MIYWISRALILFFLRMACRLLVSGAENIPKTGGFILAPNHTSYFDPPVAGSACPRRVWFMAKTELFTDPILNLWIKAVGCIPVKHGASDRHAIRRAVDLLKSGECVCIFPEGMRVAPGAVKEGEPGIAFLAQMARVPVVPMAILGTQPWHRKILGVVPWFSRISVRIGKPLRFDFDRSSGSRREDMTKMVKEIMITIRALKAGSFA